MFAEQTKPGIWQGALLKPILLGKVMMAIRAVLTIPVSLTHIRATKRLICAVGMDEDGWMRVFYVTFA